MSHPSTKQTTKEWWYVATLARYEIVQASGREEATRIGHKLLRRVFARPRIVTARVAQADEIALDQYNQRMIANERGESNR